ncbi:hypothetical protein NOCARDAX2BIS_340028 [Nocardioides sp. AX2bis]|nr:hypothetical protein NOCARDAX2BIS_340028 [Nocardioides sp. AX2bis]
MRARHHRAGRRTDGRRRGGLPRRRRGRADLRDLRQRDPGAAAAVDDRRAAARGPRRARRGVRRHGLTPPHPTPDVCRSSRLASGHRRRLPAGARPPGDPCSAPWPRPPPQPSP